LKGLEQWAGATEDRHELVTRSGSSVEGGGTSPERGKGTVLTLRGLIFEESQKKFFVGETRAKGVLT